MYVCMYGYVCIYIFVFIYLSMLEREGERERDFGAERARETSPFQNNYDVQKPHKRNLLWFVAPLLGSSYIEEVKKTKPKHTDT